MSLTPVVPTVQFGGGSDGDVLTLRKADQRWLPKPATGGGGGGSSLSRLKAYLSADQAIAAAGDRLVVLDTQRSIFGANLVFDATTGKFTALVAGTLEVRLTLAVTQPASSTSADYWYFRVWKNGVADRVLHLEDLRAAGGGAHQRNASFDIDMSAGDYIQIYVTYNSGTTVAVKGGAVWTYIDLALHPGE